MSWKDIRKAVITVAAACALVIFVLNLAANPQLFDWVLPAIIALAAALWIMGEMQQHQRQ
jgi:hypothetical protein